MQSNCIEVLFRENIFVIERLHLKYISMYVASNVVDKKKIKNICTNFFKCNLFLLCMYGFVRTCTDYYMR